MAEDYYKTLGVNRNVSQAEIQKAYRDLARKYHPDLNPDDKTAVKKFQEVQRAFDVLNDPSKRELYDRYGSSFENMGAGGGAHAQPRHGGGAAPNFEDFDFSQIFGAGGQQSDPMSGFGDIFGQFRRGRGNGGRRTRSAPAEPGADVQTEAQIPFNTSINGGEVQLALARPDGRRETIAVKIPPGIEDGKKIRLRGQGELGPTGTPGDLLIVVRIGSHPNFTRRGPNLYVRLPVTLGEAINGAKVDVPTPKGTVSLRVPTHSSSGTKLRIKGHGVQAKGKPAGDLFAEVMIMLPAAIDDSLRAAATKAESDQSLNPRHDLTW